MVSSPDGRVDSAGLSACSFLEGFHQDDLVTLERGVPSSQPGAKALFLSILHLKAARCHSQHLCDPPHNCGCITSFQGQQSPPLSFPQQSAIFNLGEFSPSCGAAYPLLPLSFEAISLALIICLSKLGMTSEIEEIVRAISTTSGRKLLKAKCYRGI